MNWKTIGAKFLKGAVGGAGTILAAQTFTGNHFDYKVFAIGLATGAFHGGWEAIKQGTSAAPTT